MLDDRNHAAAVAAWPRLRTDQLVTHNYVVLETIALLQARFGIRAVGDFAANVLGAVAIEWVGPALHKTALSSVLAAGRRGLSLVDAVSFELMRQQGIETAFAFDEDFRRAGFQILVTKR